MFNDRELHYNCQQMKPVVQQISETLYHVRKLLSQKSSKSLQPIFGFLLHQIISKPVLRDDKIIEFQSLRPLKHNWVLEC